MSKYFSQELRRTMEAVRELKQEHYIGSQNALLYLRAIRHYESLCQECRRDPMISYKPSLKEMSFLCNSIGVCASQWLHMISVKLSTVSDFGIKAIHHVVRCSDGPDFSFRAEDHVWRIDFFMVLQKALTNGKSFPAKFELAQVFNEWAELLDCFIVSNTGQRISGKEIIENPNFRNGSSDGFMGGSVLSVIDTWDLGEETRLALEAFQETRNLKGCHDIIKLLEIGMRQEIMPIYLEPDDFGLSLQPTEEEEEFLINFSSLFERAENEFTLGNYDVERKVAIGAVHGFTKSGIGCTFLSVPDLIIKAAQEWKERMLRAQKRVNRGDRDSFPGLIIKHEDRMLRRARYVYLAIYQNRVWLEKYFSS